MQQFIKKNTQDPNKSWIYSVSTSKYESVVLDHAQWTIVTDRLSVHARYLVVFKDTNLQTIRDLRKSHIPMLRQLQKVINAYFTSNMQCFFHYFPSVYQLHMHITPEKYHRITDRAHPLNCVISNITAHSTHYQNAIIMTKMHKSMKNLCIHNRLHFLEDEIFISRCLFSSFANNCKTSQHKTFFRDDMRL